jgi:hypothetical protein
MLMVVVVPVVVPVRRILPVRSWMVKGVPMGMRLVQQGDLVGGGIGEQGGAGCLVVIPDADVERIDDGHLRGVFAVADGGDALELLVVVGSLDVADGEGGGVGATVLPGIHQVLEAAPHVGLPAVHRQGGGGGDVKCCVGCPGISVHPRVAG